MKILPILFNTEMVKALLDGRKTQTRRIIQVQPSKETHKLITIVSSTDKKREGKLYWGTLKDDRVIDNDEKYFNSHINKGDILWVRETFSKIDEVDDYLYKANEDDPGSCGVWKPSIFMPKEAARIFLKVTNVRVERLQDISEQDAIKEGVEQHSDYGSTGYIHYGKPDKAFSDIDAVRSFQTLWESINGVTSWNENPFVWVYEFELTTKPSDFL